MATEYTVVQGDTMLRIAKAHGFAKSDSIYQHADNAAYRQLRPNPNIIYPGDIINIPDIVPKVVRRATNQTHRFVVSKPEVETLRFVVLDNTGQALEGCRAILVVGEQSLDITIDSDGLVELELTQNNETEAEVQVFQHGGDEPSHVFEVLIGHLDPVDTVSGVQARCNALGFDTGVVDDIMGTKTREGIKDFQSAQGMSVDGEMTQVTLDKLLELHGS